MSTFLHAETCDTTALVFQEQTGGKVSTRNFSRPTALLMSIMATSTKSTILNLSMASLTRRELKEMGYALVLVTNQSGIARGKFTEAQFETLTEWMDWSLADRGVDLDGIAHITRRVRLRSTARPVIVVNRIRGC